MKKKKIVSRMIAGAMAGIMAVTALPQLSMPDVRAEEVFQADQELIAHYPLETDALDVSGNEYHGAVLGEGVTFTGESLNLPGGKSNSNDYVSLPQGIFDHQDQLTISMWIKNNDTKGNYAAFFFGTKAKGVLPVNYLLLNPCNPKGTYKAVLTDSINESAPYNTEAGISNTVSTTEYMNQWAYYTVVLDTAGEGGSGKTLTAYLNGEHIGTASLTRSVSDFGEGLVSLIGKSEYLEDPLFKGSFRDLRIYGKCLGDTEVNGLYETAFNRNELLEAKEGLTLGDTSKVIANLTLPETVGNDVSITWESSDPTVIDHTGKVTLSDTLQNVTLTAVLMRNGETVSKEFEVTVIAADGVLAEAMSRVNVPYAITDKTVLPTSLGDGITVSWECSDPSVIAGDGTITAQDQNMQLELKAAIAKGDQLAYKEFVVLVMEKTANYVMSYTRNGNTELTDSMHLAYSADGGEYTSLNYNTGILYPKADLEENEANTIAGTTKRLRSPYLFRMADGKIGVTAVRTDAAGDKNAKGKILLYTTDDLMEYEDYGLISLHTELAVTEPRCEYDGVNKVYRITWKGSDGRLYCSTTADFVEISAPEEITGRENIAVSAQIAGAVPCNVLPVTMSEAQGLTAKLLPIENTGIEEQKFQFATKAGQKLTKDDIASVIKANYSDGTEKEIKVNWDANSLKSINFNKAGTYQINGTAKLTKYPVLNGRADPDIYFYNGKYYFIATGETANQSQINIREADTPLGLFGATDHELIPNVRKPRWAPELHEINGKLYIFLAVGDDWKQVQSSIMELKEGGNPTNKNDWKEAVRVRKQDGSYLYEDGITLDMTYFEVNGISYVCWAQREMTSDRGFGTSDLYIAAIDKENPYQLTSDPMCILRPQYGWDRFDATVDEGPYVIQRDGTVYMTFSGSSVSNTYCVGLLTAAAESDLLDAASWKETGYPILQAESVAGEGGPGHSAFTVDEDGNDLFVYHMKPNGGTRSASARRVHWAADGTPVLGMTVDRELKEEYRSVAGTIIVEEGDVPEDQRIVAADKEALTLNGVTENIVKGNLTLSSEGKNGSQITWISDKEEVISAVSSENKAYAATPAGTVTRGSKDQKVTLRAVIRYGTFEDTKTFNVTVKAKEAAKDYVGYLYAYFSGDESRMDDQQIYFALSKDGITWSDLNENNPVLTSALGDKSVRDPYIIRSAEGDRFYLIATDLDIRNGRYGNQWWTSRDGSKDLIIWESRDLVNWTNHRAVDVGSSIQADHVWAPEAIYDEITGEYLVYWSSSVKTDQYEKSRIYVAKTRDFYTFTEPEVYSDDPNGNIDASILKVGQKYYRLIKDDREAYVTLESADQLLSYGDGEKNRGSVFKKIKNTELESYKGYYEGPTMFRFQNENKWCALVDEYGGAKRGYIPFISEDIGAENSLHLMKDDTYLMPTGAKHGTVIPVTQEEFDALQEKWIVKSNMGQQEEPVLEYNFEEKSDGTITDVSGNGNHGKTYGNAVFKKDAEKGQVLYLDGSSGTYAEFPRGLFDGCDEMTIEMDVKPEITSNFFFTFGMGQDSSKYMFLRTKPGNIRNAITTQGNGKERDVQINGSYQGKWSKVAIVMNGHSMSLYIDGVLADKRDYVRSVSDLGSNLLAYLGKSFYSNDPYFKGSFDNVKVYNRVLSAKELGGDDPELDISKDLLAHYKLEDDGKDASGKQKDAVMGGKGTHFTDGVLCLDGGAKSDKNYVTLPAGLFDGQNSTTISMWIKNKNTKMNTAAFSFSGKKKTGIYPADYFILNPCNTDGYYKAVFTDPAAGSTANPWTTEVGINNSSQNSISTLDYMNQWAYYTVTITKDRINGYLNGKKVGTSEIHNKTVADFGEKLSAYIGASEYADDTFAGNFCDLRIYSREFNMSEVSDLYQKSLPVKQVKEARASLKIGNGLSVTGNLDLPVQAGECTVKWKSGQPAVVEENGTVHFQKDETTVTLTAVISSGAYAEESVYELTIASEKDAAAGRYRTALSIPKYISCNMQTEVNGEAVIWSSEPKGVIDADGTVHRPAGDQENKEIMVKAVIGDTVITKQATVMAEGGQILSYVVKGGNLYTGEGDLLAASDSRRSDALFLAARDQNSDVFMPLNKGKAVLYVKWDKDQKTNPDNQMGSPVLFRYQDGSLGAAASGNNKKDGIYIWDTRETTSFENERYLVLNTEGKEVQDPDVVYDSMAECYKIFWKDEQGTSYVSMLSNLNAGSTPVITEEADYEKAALSAAVPENAVMEQSAIFEADREEYKAFTKKYETIRNTGVESVVIRANTGDKVTLPETVTADYSDGSTKNLGVKWNQQDLDKIANGQAGTYEISGEVQQDSYAYPFIEERADPHIFYNEDDGYYYSTGSYYEKNMNWNNESDARNNSYRKLDIRRAKTIEGLKTANEHYIMESKIGDRWGSFIWAPEFHKINGKWYCIVGAHDFGTAGIKNDTDWGWCSRSILIPYEGSAEQMKNGGMLNADQWGTPIEMNLPAPANASFDVSYYEDEGGQGYYIIPSAANLYVIKAKGGEGVIPQPEGSPQLIKSGQWPWEYGVYEGSITVNNPEGNDQLVVEGPYLFSYGDKVYISYSAATVDKFYTLGLMMADKGSDIMNPDSWTNINYPVLSSYDTADGSIGGGRHVGGGHNSVVLDEYGNLALVYHARPYPDPHAGKPGAGGLFDPCRHTVVKSINVAFDGTLLFNMTAEEELDPAYKNIKAVVYISGKEAADKTALKELIQNAKKTDTAKYTEASVKVMKEALAKAEAVMNKADASQSETDQAAAALKNAIAKLEPKKAVPVPEKISVQGVQLNKKVFTMKVKSKVTLTAVITPSNASNKAVSWTSSNKSVASVNGNGIILAGKPGTAVVTVCTADGGKKASCTITVKAPVIKLNARAITLQVKKTTTAVKISSSSPAGEKIRSAKSGNKKLVSGKVKKGKLSITGKKKGSTYITVTSTLGGKVKLNVKVQTGKVVTKSIKLDKKLKIPKGKSLALKAVRYPVTATEKLEWTSSNKKVAKVTSKGLVKAKKNGTTTITVKSSNGKSAKCKITVK